MSASEAETGNPRRGPDYWAKWAFVRLGVLPFLVVLALIVFTAMSDNFLSVRNLTNVVRQSVYLTIVSLGQMLALFTGGFDLSVGTILALTSVVGAMVMAMTYAAHAGRAARGDRGRRAGGDRGGRRRSASATASASSAFGVSPFIMTLGMSSVGFGIALFLTGGVPVYGMPVEFGDIFGFGSFLGVPVPIWVAAVLVVLTFVLVNWTPLGRYFYAVGGNAKAAQLSGINTRKTLFITYVLVAFLTSIVGHAADGAPRYRARPISARRWRWNRSPPASSPACRCAAASGGWRTSCSARSSSCWCRTA